MSARMDAWKLSYEEVHFLGTPGLFTSLRVSLRSLPDSVHRYEIREEGGGPCQLARGVLADHFGTLLTTDPIQLPPDGYLSFEDQDLEWGNGGAVTLAEFLRKYPPTGRDVIELWDALPEERDLLYSWDDGRDVKNGCIGHLRGDFEAAYCIILGGPTNGTRCATTSDSKRTSHVLLTGCAPALLRCGI